MKIIRFSINMTAGLGSIETIAEVLENVGFPRKLTVIGGPTTMKLIGNEVTKRLIEGGFIVNTEVVEGGATKENADELVNRVRKSGSEGIVGVGGGSIIDLAKYVGHVLNLRVVSVPTTLSSDAIASPFSVIWSGGKSMAIKTKAPDVIIGDYDVLLKEPHRFVAAGFGDMIAKYTALYDWRLAYWLGDEPYLDFAAQLADSILQLLIRRVNDVARQNYIGIETLFYAEVTDGYLMELANTTRVAAGCEHLIAFAIESTCNAGIHGEQVGIGTIICAYLQNRDYRMVRELLSKVGSPTTAEQLGTDKECLIRALTIAHAMRPWYTILGTRGISSTKAERLLRYSGVIS
ncbi:iron-containing alcohol dehydrogenase [Vulcanisaeta thermophila]|uniref:iron-containing alcohol dehydrogenase n=1 Tax=Vulcanisaeta thermophila TaxID=867917 RepID=UPI000852C72B|nr:iron-containing alcohol dehydrogenase [Vulcanisaeta thermophila]